MPIIEDVNAPATFRKEHASIVVDVSDNYLIETLNLSSFNDTEIEQKLACDKNWFNRISSGSSSSNMLPSLLMLILLFICKIF